MAADKVGSLPCGWTVTDRHGVAHKAPPHFPLARDKVRYVGDHVAVVIARTYAEAKEAGEQVTVDYEELPAVRSEEHTSELQSLMRISYAVFCLKKKKK